MWWTLMSFFVFQSTQQSEVLMDSRLGSNGSRVSAIGSERLKPSTATGELAKLAQSPV